jgi:hypothetical protein
VYGANILKDPGFELQLANFSGGPLGDEIPQTADFSGVDLPYEWDDETDAGVNTFWVQRNVASSLATDRYWSVQTVNPRSGTYHARIRTGVTSGNNQQTLYCAQLRRCVWETEASGKDAVAAVVAPGDFVRWGVWLSVDTLADDPIVLVESDLYSESSTYLDSFFQQWTISSTGYVWYEVSGFAPATAQFATAYIYVQASLLADTYWDVDDCVLEVQD